MKITSKYLSFIGDVHGDFNSIFPKLNMYEDTTFILLGDCEIGFPETRLDKLKKVISYYTKQLEKRNNYLLLIRGNHDDPIYFNDESFRKEYSNDRFILLQDYTELFFEDKNILCIGGAVSIDRRFRKDGISWWVDEELIDKIELDYNLNKRMFKSASPDILLTHTCNKEWISYLLPRLDWIRRSFEEDKKLKYDCLRENSICDKMLLMYQPDMWFCGHYHISHIDMISNNNVDMTYLQILNINEIYDYRGKNENR